MRLILTALMALVLVATGGDFRQARAASPVPDLVRAAGASLPQDIRIAPGSLVVSRQDMLCLALNDYWEARGESLRGRVAVAQVVLNRARDPRFPGSLCDVITDDRSHASRRCQFSWACDGKSDTPANPEVWRSSVLLALSVLRRDNAINDPTGGALWYHARAVRPSWTRSLTRTVRIGAHYFYTDDQAPQIAMQSASRDPAQTADMDVPTTFADWSDDPHHGVPKRGVIYPNRPQRQE
ncbi:cell wall hydrolase [Pararhodospirillum oryzae]|uniref:Hydrolase n=1 Tax=Pararhodospirillum oryzae TaxID=478448 RepID=A0A512H5T2_9PROT|nr:cell wall hydrolase [Pararhodospirillum oryzae]GEO80740.1 hydrolase [Pararhodospirillum oryzae]